MLTAEVPLYPQKTTNASQIINNSIDTLRQHDLQIQEDSRW